MSDFSYELFILWQMHLKQLRPIWTQMSKHKLIHFGNINGYSPLGRKGIFKQAN